MNAEQKQEDEEKEEKRYAYQRYLEGKAYFNIEMDGGITIFIAEWMTTIYFSIEDIIELAKEFECSRHEKEIKELKKMIDEEFSYNSGFEKGKLVERSRHEKEIEQLVEQCCDTCSLNCSDGCWIKIRYPKTVERVFGEKK